MLKKNLQNNSLVSDIVEWEFKARKMKIFYYLKCACICSKTATLLTSTQLKHYREWKRLRQWRIRLYTKLIMNTCQRWTSQKRASQAVAGLYDAKMFFCWWLILSGCKHVLCLLSDLMAKCLAWDSHSQPNLFSVTEVANGTFQFILKETPSPRGTLICRPSWLCSMKNVPKSTVTCREWWERKMCLRLPF